jgi:hypothetical protein
MGCWWLGVVFPVPVLAEAVAGWLFVTTMTEFGAGVATGLGVVELALTEDATELLPLVPPGILGRPRTTSASLLSNNRSSEAMLLAAPGRGGKELASIVKLSATGGT